MSTRSAALDYAKVVAAWPQVHVKSRKMSRKKENEGRTQKTFIIQEEYLVKSQRQTKRIDAPALRREARVYLVFLSLISGLYYTFLTSVTTKEYYLSDFEMAKTLMTHLTHTLLEPPWLFDRFFYTIAKLDEQLAARHSLLTQLNTKHDPMGNRLPVEITSKIFQHCLPDLPSPETFENSSRESNTDHEFSQTTAKLTSINQNWRSIAHSTPELWTSIFLNFTRWSISGDRLPIILTNVKQRIQRSSNLLLSIRLIAGEGHALVSYSAQMLEAFSLEAHRWRSLCISAPRKVISVISTQTFPKGPTNSTIVSFLDFLPRLMTLECQICNGDQTFNSNPPLLHPSLKTLKLTAIEAVPNLLAKITLPALETLICRFNSNEHTTLRDFLSRSSCPIQTLSIIMPCSEQELIDILLLTPGIRHLPIQTQITSRFFSISRRDCLPEQSLTHLSTSPSDY
ncbi:hypothetical protein CPB83DRAFT_887855 [Crepidotus variabilis]|uniref:F-box domain-containing protein n=1 Tax=Crepidotus variabilis TaxID=179855 RepID=A0A9P6E3C4_9AGAR|nr:hypothetical protein CPB83DRAFT_887855 [Crepidotus variabilis]